MGCGINSKPATNSKPLTSGMTPAAPLTADVEARRLTVWLNRLVNPSGSSPRRCPIRRQILDAAVALIAEIGWGEITTRKVAERAGVNNALIHYYFGSKDALLREAIRVAFTEEFEGPITALIASPDIHLGIDGFFDAVAALGPGSTDALLAIEGLVQGLRDPESREWMTGMLSASRTTLAEIIRQGQEAGAVRADLDPDGAALVLIGSLDALVLYRFNQPDLDLESVRSALHTMLGP
jgi:AcrR family transcriptional regulator